MKKLTLTVLSIILLSACSARSVLVHKKVNYEPDSEARVRIYNVNGNKTTFVLNDTSCQDIKNEPNKKISRNPFSKQNSHNGLPRRSLKNISIGMPLTEKSVQALNRKSYFQTTSFEEKIVEANKKIVIKGSYFFDTSSSTSSCNIMGELTLQAGKDYEVSFGLITVEGKKACRMFVNELEPYSIADNNQITAKVGKEIKYSKCEK